jgi:NodT family efflux transporter outer membrane factor (OMF) lipoprotein
MSASCLSACTIGPDFVRPETPKDASFTAEKLAPVTASAKAPGGSAQRFAPGEDIPGQWWTLFQSPSLNALIEEALKANPDIEAAQAALRQARENAYAEQGSLFPTIGGTASATREKTSSSTSSSSGFSSGSSTGSAGFGGSSNSAFSPTLSVTTASLSVSYAPDIFGGVRRQIESAEAQGEYQRFQLEATYLTLTSNVVNSAITLASLRDQIAATHDIIEIETDQLTLMKKRYGFGVVSQSDVLSQEATLAQMRANLPPLEKQLAQARNQLMTYIGRFPSENKGESFALASLQLPKELPLSLPSQLVEQRPDVREAQAQLHEASANIGVAIANQLPQFSITGQLGSSSNNIANLFSPGTGLWSIGGSIAQTFFDGGSLEHKKRAAVAAYDESAAQYRGAVLLAFQDVANALRAIQSDADALNADAAAERSASANLDLARKQYRLGTIDQLAVLNAEQTYHNAVLTRVRAQAARDSDTAALFQALGGGWWNRTDLAPESEGSPDRFALPPFQDVNLPKL